MDQDVNVAVRREPWNKGKLVGQKAPLRLKDISAIRIRLQLAERIRELPRFNLAGCHPQRGGGDPHPRCR
jgi:hypothetical protein